MVTNTHTTPAAPYSHSEPSFVMPTGAAAFWNLARTGHAATGFGAVTVRDIPLSVDHQALTAVRRNRIATKQAGPPRGTLR
jgi:hypothetical protein